MSATGETAADVLEAYRSGRIEFMGVSLLAAPGALVPRHETEMLGRTALRLLKERGPTPRAIDMCCGSGNLACALAVQLPSLSVIAADLTDGTVELARRNVAQLNLGDRVQVLQGDLFSALAPLSAPPPVVDVVVCNPPYISTGRLEKDRALLLEHEPREAFDGGPYGLSIHQRVLKEALPFLAPDGWVAFEFGAGQERQLELLFGRAKAYGPVHFEKDLSGAPRVAYAQKRP